MGETIPVWEKYILTMQEASAYFGIGINRFRKIVNEHKDAPWVLWNGVHAQIKRKAFEEYIDSINSINVM